MSCNCQLLFSDRTVCIGKTVESSFFTYTYSASKHKASVWVVPTNSARQASSTSVAPLLRSH
jgi:hypothetical protein